MRARHKAIRGQLVDLGARQTALLRLANAIGQVEQRLVVLRLAVGRIDAASGAVGAVRAARTAGGAADAAAASVELLVRDERPESVGQQIAAMDYKRVASNK